MAFLIASDGARLVHDDDGAGRPLLLIHGLNANASFFAPQAAALAGRFRVVRPDLRGHGRTPAAGALTIERLADDVAELVEALDLRDVIGVGWSLGAMVLWQALLGRAGAAFAGMVSIDMTPKVLNVPGWTLGLIDESLRAGDEDEDRVARGRRIAAAIVAAGARAERAALIAWMAEQIATADLDAIAALNRSLVAQDMRNALPAIRVPVLAAYGARSQYYAPATSAYVAGRVADGRTHAFDRSGHVPQLEEPEAFTRMLGHFADGLPMKAAAPHAHALERTRP